MFVIIQLPAWIPFLNLTITQGQDDPVFVEAHGASY